MIPILFSADSTTFTTNGLGGLADAISCKVTEVRNGEYTLEMVYPLNGIHFEDITYSAILKVTPSDGASDQLFRIYKISTPLNGKVTIEANHISYQLSFIPVGPFTASSCSSALQGLVTNSMETNPFSVWTDKGTSADYEQTLPESFRSRLGGVSGSILDLYGGEYEFDNYTVKLHSARGANRGVTLRYGKNITDIKQEENIANTITGICPYWTDGTTTVTGDIQYSSNASNFPYKRTVVKDFSQAFDSQPTQAELESYTQSYITNNNIGVPAVSINVSFIALWQTEGYADVANLERVKLCDTVNIEYEKLGISATAKVVKTVYDVLKERYEKIELGEAKTNLAKTISDIQQQTTELETSNSSALQRAIAHATELITGGLGGYVVLNTDADGHPTEILIMDTDDITTATDVWRFNSGGLGHSSTGYDGPFDDVALTADGQINADLITTGKLVATMIQGGTLTLGGEDNANGVLQILNADSEVIGQWDKDGITIINGDIRGPSITIGDDDGGSFVCMDSGYGVKYENSSFVFYSNNGSAGSIGGMYVESTGERGIAIGNSHEKGRIDIQTSNTTESSLNLYSAYRASLTGTYVLFLSGQYINLVPSTALRIGGTDTITKTVELRDSSGNTKTLTFKHGLLVSCT